MAVETGDVAKTLATLCIGSYKVLCGDKRASAVETVMHVKLET